VRRATASAANTAVAFVAHVDDADAACLRRGEDRRDVAAAEREQAVHAVRLQRGRHAVAAVLRRLRHWIHRQFPV